MDTRFSGYGRASVEPSPVSLMMDSFASDFRDGVDINLGVGYVNEKTIPVARLSEAMHAVTGDPARYRQAFNYGGPQGSANLIRALGEFLRRRLDAETLARKRLIVGPCGATSILEGLAEVMAPGIVVTSDPMYYIYTDVLERKGFEVLAVPEDGEGIRLDALEGKLAGLGERAGEIAFFYVVTVNNPSCTILANARRRALAEMASRLSRRQNRRIPIFFDLAYELLVHDPAVEPLSSALPGDELEIVYEIGTLSKVLAPALRLGYLVGPDGPLMRAMVQRTSDTGFSAPLFVQEMAGYMLEQHVDEQLRAVNAGYREKALAVREGIEASLGPYLEECRGGSAGFYFYLTLSGIETHTRSQFFEWLIRPTAESRVIYIPGEYCVHRAGEMAELGRRQLRLSYGFEETPRILCALELMRQAAEMGRRNRLPHPSSLGGGDEGRP